MKKRLVLPSILKQVAKAETRMGRRSVRIAAVALALVTLYSSSLAAAGVARTLLRGGTLNRAFVAAPSFLQPVLAVTTLVTPQQGSNTLNVERRGHTATRLPDGRVLVVGGESAGGPLSSSEIFDPATQTFIPGASAGAARTEHAAVRLNNGRIFITGGRDQSGSLASTEIFDPSSGTFTAGPAMGHTRAGHTATLLADGRVLVVGGDEEGSVEVFDAQAANVTALDEPLYTARMNHSALLLNDGKVLIVGGVGPFGNQVQSAEMFDPAEEGFSAIPGAVKVPRTRPTLREMPNGFVQVIGGDDEGTIEVYVPATDDFQAYAHLPGSTPVADALRARTRSALFRQGQTDAMLNRAAHTVTEIPQSNLALVAGGVTSGGQILNTVAVVNSSAATVTTDKIDYAPGELVTITGTGFQPNETVTLVLHEEQAAHPDRTFTSVANGSGNFTNTDFVPETHHFGVHFVLTAKGQSSAFVAQTGFTDAGNTDIRVVIGNTFRFYGQTAPPLRAKLCIPITDGSGDCTPVNGKTIEFAINGEVVGTDVTSTKEIEGELIEGMAVFDYAVLKNFGAYTIVATFAGDEEYQADQGTSTLQIGKALTIMTYTPVPSPITYGTAIGASHVNATIKDNTASSPFFGQPVAGTFTYALTTLGGVPPLGVVPNAGSNTIRADFVPTDTLNYNSAFRNGSFTVSKILLTVTPANQIRLYGEANPTLTGTVVGLVNNDPITPTYTTTATQASVPGNYPITFTLADPGNKLRNYNQPAPLKTGTLAINKAPLTLTAHDKSRAYGADNPPLTFSYSGFMLGQTASTPGVLSGTPSLTTTATAASPGGTYPITISLGTLAASNYVFNTVNASLTVTKTQSVLNLSGLSQTFDGTPKPVTVTTEPAGLTGVTVTYGGSSQAPTNAGSYVVTATLNNPNYQSETITGTLVINKAEQQINFASIPEHTFGDAPFALNATSNSGLPVSLEVVSGNATFSGNTLTLNGTGPVTIRASQSGDANRNPAPDVLRTFEVRKAAATINIDPTSLSQTYSGTGKAATVTTTPAGLSGVAISYTQNGVAVTAPTNVGSYVVTATLDNPNYTAAPASGTLVIGQATVQVNLESATYVFDGMPHLVNSTVNGPAGQNIGTLSYTYAPQGNVGPDSFEPELPPLPPSQGDVPPAPAYTTLNDPPSSPHLITVFPERDFVTAENYSATADGEVTINVLRRNAAGVLVTVGSAKATPQDDPATPAVVEGVVEVNHPGGACWVGLTPNIRPGDIVRITNSSGVADQTTVAHVSAGRPVKINATTVRISGRAMDAEGNPLPLGQIEQRLITSSADRFELNNRRDLRAPGNGTLVYDDDEDPTHWTATYTGLSVNDMERVFRAETRILWLGRTPAAENEITIFEIGDDVFGGPAAPCSAPLEGTSPPRPFPVPPAPAYTTLNDPPPSPHLITVFPERDFVTIENYSATDGPVTINVLRSVTLNGITTLRTVGSSTVELQDDPLTPQFDGFAEVNHPGGGCWVGSTPDIQPGDIVRVTTASGVADQTTVANVKAERVIQTSPNTVVIHGTAQNAAGQPLPIDLLEQRMISSSADRFNVNGRRDIRAVSDGGEVGTLSYDAPGSIHWTATYTNLGSQDVARALRSETRILWLGRDEAAENEITIFEIGDDVFGGPAAPCSAPREGTDVPVWVGVYDVSVSLNGNPNFRVMANTAQITINKATPVVNASGGPFPYDGLPHPATVAVIGINEQPFVPPTANTTITYTLGGLSELLVLTDNSESGDTLAGGSQSDASVTAGGEAMPFMPDRIPMPTEEPPVQSGTYAVRASFAGSKNYNAAEGSHSLIIINDAPVAYDESFTTNEDTAITFFFNATDNNGDPLNYSIVTNPAHGTLTMGRSICPSPLIYAAMADQQQAQLVGGFSCTGQVTYTPNANYNGTDTLTFMANDGQADSNVATVTITVNAVNDVPQINAGPDKTIAEGGTFTSTGSFSDMDNAGTWTATVNYGAGAGVKPLTLNADKSFALSNVYADNGSYTVTVTVTDSAGASATDTVVVTSTNVAPKPTITGAPYSIPEGSTINLVGSATDPSVPDTNAGLSYLWTVTKNGSAFAQSGTGIGTPNLKNFSFTADEDANYLVTLKVTDKDGGAGTTTKYIIVTNVEPSDDFNDNAADTGRWFVSNMGGSTALEQNARLEVTPAASSASNNGYFARVNTSLVNRRATVEVIQSTPVTNGIETVFNLLDDVNGTHLQMSLGGTGLALQYFSPSTGVASREVIPFDAAQHRFWRIRHDSATDTVFWETSGEGTQWTVRRKAARPFDLSKMKGRLYVSKTAATVAASKAIFDNYRIEDVPPSSVLLSDDFNDNSTDTSKWAATAPTGMTVVEQNQRVEMTPPASAYGYGGYSSTANYNMTDSRAKVEVVQATANAGIETIFHLADKTVTGTNPTTNDLIFVVGGANLIMQERAGGVVTTRTIIPYDATQHRFWRFRHDSVAARMYWETSPDGLQWTARHAAAVTVALTQMQLSLSAGKPTSVAATSPTATAVFDNLAIERYPALSPSDNFNDNALDTTRWLLLNSAAFITVREQNQRVEMALPANTAAFNGISSVSSTNFWNKTLSVEIPQATNTGGVETETYFRLLRNDYNYFHVLIRGDNTFVLDAVTDGVLDRTQFNYNPVTNRFWRIRHHAATHKMNFESSADGVTWTTLKTVNVSIPLDNVRAFLTTYSAGNNSTPGSAIYDNLKMESNE